MSAGAAVATGAVVAAVAVAESMELVSLVVRTVAGKVRAAVTVVIVFVLVAVATVRAAAGAVTTGDLSSPGPFFVLITPINTKKGFLVKRRERREEVEQLGDEY